MLLFAPRAVLTSHFHVKLLNWVFYSLTPVICNCSSSQSFQGSRVFALYKTVVTVCFSQWSLPASSASLVSAIESVALQLAWGPYQLYLFTTSVYSTSPPMLYSVFSGQRLKLHSRSVLEAVRLRYVFILLWKLFPRQVNFSAIKHDSESTAMVAALLSWTANS